MGLHISWYGLSRSIYWLVVWNMNSIFPDSWDDDPIWLSYFSGGVKPPTKWDSPFKNVRTLVPSTSETHTLHQPVTFGVIPCISPHCKPWHQPWQDLNHVLIMVKFPQFWQGVFWYWRRYAMIHTYIKYCIAIYICMFCIYVYIYILYCMYGRIIVTSMWRHWNNGYSRLQEIIPR